MTKKHDETTQDFERLVAAGGDADTRFLLQLYVTGMSVRSTEAIAAVKAVCEERLRGRYRLEIIDLYEHPEAARGADIVAAPTLVRQQPLPRRKLVGSMSSRERLLEVLDLMGVP